MASTKYVALKRFGGGKDLRKKYGSGVSRLVQKGTVIDGDDMVESHCRDLESKKLIEKMKPGKKYETQAGVDKKAKNRKRDEEAAKKAAEEEAKNPKTKAQKAAEAKAAKEAEAAAKAAEAKDKK